MLCTEILSTSQNRILLIQTVGLRSLKNSYHRFSYFPFGGGTRGCIGEPFAWLEAILLISTICKQWKMTLEPGHKVALKPLITLRPKHGMRMLLTQKIRLNNPIAVSAEKKLISFAFILHQFVLSYYPHVRRFCRTVFKFFVKLDGSSKFHDSFRQLNNSYLHFLIPVIQLEFFLCQ